MSTSTTIRSTVRTVERGVRVGPKSQSQSHTNLTITARSSSGHRSSSPAVDHVKQQLCAFIDHSQLEKSELAKLNDRMSSYVNRVKALEKENTCLMGEIGDIQAHWGEGTRKIREQYEQSLFDLRGRIDDVANLKTIAEVRNKRAQYENNEFQKRVDDTCRIIDNDKTKIKNLERELVQLRENKEILNKSLKDQLNDLDKYRLNRDETWSNLVDLLDKLDDELFRRISVEYNNQTLREHIEFLKQIHEKELLEMSQLADALPFNDQIEFYKDQLKRVITNIRNDYEQLNLEQQRELEEWMRVKTEELAAKAKARDPIHDLEMNLQLETIESLRDTYDCNNKELEELKRQYECLQSRLRKAEEHVEDERRNINDTMNKQNEEVKKLNDDLDNLLNDYNHINSNKASLEYELNVYKRLLDSQLDRFNAEASAATTAKRTTTTTIENTLNQTIVSSNAFGGKVQNKKEKKGSIGISDSSPDGKFIIIENISTPNQSSTTIDLSNWIIKRKVDANNEIIYKIPSGITLPPNKEITVWASSYRQQRSNSDLIAEFENWGIGINSVTRLVTSNGEEKSSFYQHISFSNQY